MGDLGAHHYARSKKGKVDAGMRVPPTHDKREWSARTCLLVGGFPVQYLEQDAVPEPNVDLERGVKGGADRVEAALRRELLIP